MKMLVNLCIRYTLLLEHVIKKYFICRLRRNVFKFEISTLLSFFHIFTSFRKVCVKFENKSIRSNNIRRSCVVVYQA